MLACGSHMPGLYNYTVFMKVDPCTFNSMYHLVSTHNEGRDIHVLDVFNSRVNWKRQSCALI